MDSTKLDDFVANAALLAAHLTRQCDAAAARQYAAARELDNAASGLTERVAGSRTELAQTVSSAIRTAMPGEAEAASRVVTESTQRLRDAVIRFETAQSHLDTRMRWLGGGVILVVVMGAGAMLGASGFLARQNLQRADRASVRAEVLEALEQVTITSCDGAPCIKLEPGLRRWSRNDEYVLVDTAAPAP